MQPERYRSVIRMVLNRNTGKDTDTVTTELIKAIEIAQALAGEYEPDPGTQLMTAIQSLNSGAIAQSGPSRVLPFRAPAAAEAPPVAGTERMDDPEPVEYWGPQKLTEHLERILPERISVLTGDSQVELVRGISNPGPPMKFVKVGYTIPGKDAGASFTAMITTRTFDADTILKDITTQVQLFSAPKRPVVSSFQKAPPLTSRDLETALSRDAAQRPQSEIYTDETRRDLEVLKGRS